MNAFVYDNSNTLVDIQKNVNVDRYDYNKNEIYINVDKYLYNDFRQLKSLKQITSQNVSDNIHEYIIIKLNY